MTAADLLVAIDHLDPTQHDITGVLGFLRLIVANNPNKSVADLRTRPDLVEAESVITDWIADARKINTALGALVPAGEKSITKSVDKTLDGFARDTALDRIDDWRNDDTPVSTWAAKIVLRMTWQRDWLRSQAEWVALGAPYKRWVSRLDERTCKYCRGLHGTVVPTNRSFARPARLLGYKRIYGGLFAPPLHPRCRCRLEPVTSLPADTSGEP